MTQIALGPSIRSIMLPDGLFRIIALQETGVALNRQLMSPAILSRFEKHELKPSHLLNEVGRRWLRRIESHPVRMAMPEDVKRRKFFYGYHDEFFVSLALQFQDGAMTEEPEDPVHSAWMRVANPAAMIQLERDSGSDPDLLRIYRHYRNEFVLDGIDDALDKIQSNRLVIITNTLSYLEIAPSNKYRYFTIQLFDIQSEVELYRLLDSIKAEHLVDPAFCLVIQYDAMTGPLKSFQLAKYEVEQRLDKTKCRVAFIVHVDPHPVNMHWTFSFGDDWEYCFADEVVSMRKHCLPLSKLVVDDMMYVLIKAMPTESFKLMLLEMLGPILQTSLNASLHSNLGQFFSGVRTALQIPNNELLINILKGIIFCIL